MSRGKSGLESETFVHLLAGVVTVEKERWLDRTDLGLSLFKG